MYRCTLQSGRKQLKIKIITNSSSNILYKILYDSVNQDTIYFDVDYHSFE